MQRLMGPRYCTSLTSWFCVPEQGMKEFEVLSRASAFFVKSDGRNMVSKDVNRSFPKGGLEQTKSARKFLPHYHVVTSSHVVSPWLWQKYYPDEWLQFVNEAHTYYTLEIRDDNGVFVTQIDCNPVSYHHPKKDLAILHIDQEAESLKILETIGLEMPPLLPQSSEWLYTGLPLHFQGHEVISVKEEQASCAFPSDVTAERGTANASERGEEDSRKPIPRDVLGTIARCNDSLQVFSTTDKVLTDGMCGGPVLCKAKDILAASTDITRGEVLGQESLFICGLTEGIVPLDHTEKSLRGRAVFIESDNICEFVSAVEVGDIQALVGGDVLEHVGNNTRELSEVMQPSAQSSPSNFRTS